MAYTSSIDELNNLQTEQDKQKIRAYFEEMDLEPEEIEKRIGVANDLDNLYLILFLLMTASVAAGENVIDQNAYWNDYLTRGYNDVLTENGYNTDDPMVSNRIDETVAEVLNTTYEHIAQTYYLSHDRALMIASNDTNAFANYEYHIRKIKEGYTRKRWVTKVDKKTRHDHVWADGQEVDIQMPFIVGGYEMLFPLDQSLGADAKEVVNCRCVARYLGKKNRVESKGDSFSPITDKAIENVKVPEYPDEVLDREWLKTESQSVLQYSKDNNESMEVAKLYNADKGYLNTIKGTKNEIDLNVPEFSKTSILIHNHPSNKSFSNVDIVTFLSSNKLTHMVVVKNNGNLEMIVKNSLYDRRQAVIEYKRLEKKYSVAIAKDEQKGYSQVVESFLTKNKSGIDFIR